MAFKQLDDFRFQLPLTTEIVIYPDLFLMFSIRIV